MKDNFIFIINPISGKGKGKMIQKDIENYFSAKNINIEIHFTKYNNHATKLTKEALNKKPSVIVACGGDGTINEVAQVLVGTDIILGIIPIGSGNGLAANLNIPKNLYKALDLILSKKTKTIDVGKINTSYFFSNVGFGIDAFVIDAYSKSYNRNFVGYLKASLKTVLKYKPQKFKISSSQNEATEGLYYFLFCSNSNQAGYGISFTPNAKLNDGKLDLVLVKNINFIKQLKFSVFTLLKNINKMKEAEVKQITSLFLKSETDKITAQIDGECVILNSSEIEINVVPEALTVIKL